MVLSYKSQPERKGDSGSDGSDTYNNPRVQLKRELADLPYDEQAKRVTPPAPVQMQGGPRANSGGGGGQSWEAEGQKFHWADPSMRPSGPSRLSIIPGQEDTPPSGYLVWDEFKKTDRGKEELSRLKTRAMLKAPPKFKMPTGPPTGKKDRDGINGALGILDEFSGSASAKSGTFVSASLGVSVPIPQVPGLFIDVSVEANYEEDHTGEKLLEGKIKLGAKYSIFKILEIYGGALGVMKLEGKDLGDAFIDMVKQLTRKALEEAGIQKAMVDMYRMAKEGPSVGDFLETLIPGPGYLKAAGILISQIGGVEGVKKTYVDYHLFFRNNPAVGFEVAAGFYGGISIGVSQANMKAEGEAMVGLMDEDKKETKYFAELNGKVEAALGPGSVSVFVSKRWIENSDSRFTIQLSAEFPVGTMYDFQLEALGVSFADDPAFQKSLAIINGTEEEGDFGDAITDISEAFVDAATPSLRDVTVPGIVAKKVGVELKLTKQGSVWEVSARLKKMDEVSADVAIVSGKVQAGTFVDISAKFQSKLPKLKSKAS